MKTATDLLLLVEPRGPLLYILERRKTASLSDLLILGCADFFRRVVQLMTDTSTAASIHADTAPAPSHPMIAR